MLCVYILDYQPPETTCALSQYRLDDMRAAYYLPLASHPVQRRHGATGKKRLPLCMRGWDKSY